ncbi:hypothetical protein J2X47_000623 [Sphingomonas sp. BE270]|jgi:hypothetical protein|uniref:hypothetical protein n=1 Tax=Sphingomonas sp. BE270 TaxID=2817726 RepID=UPI00286431DA|nr:hypothetical protein [Sphingomonas sp. BE270]MDR7256462.1 hypothetical protein [Sphingomonas sp. BE270]
MTNFVERVLTEELSAARKQLEDVLIVLDEHAEGQAAYHVCAAIERLIGAPSTMEQWYLMTGRAANGEPLS